MILNFNSKTGFYTLHDGFSVNSPELQGTWDGTPISLQKELEAMSYFVELTVISTEDEETTWLDLSGLDDDG